MESQQHAAWLAPVQEIGYNTGMTIRNPDEFIRRMPKTDLHVHLDGSIRPETLLDLARARKIVLPTQTADGLNDLVFKERYQDLVEYLRGFHYTVAVMQTAEALERIAYEFAWDNFNEGVRYFEVRFAPQLHTNSDLPIEEVFLSVHRGLERAKKEFNGREDVVDGREPPANYGIIACAMRAFSKGLSEYYDLFLTLHRFSKPKRTFSLASVELVHAIIHARDELGLPVVGLDIAGPEDGFPPEDHEEAFDLAHRNFFKKTVHAGEAYGPESIFQAITLLHADRIGHGYHLFSTNMLMDDTVTDKASYVNRLAEFIADRRITIEVCLTSNQQTMPALGDLRNHAFGIMLGRCLSVTLCTDNRTVSKTTVSREITLAIETFKPSPDELKNMVIYGFKRSFYPGSYREKRDYVRRNIDYYESLQDQYIVDER